MKINPKDFTPAKTHVLVTTGEIIRILREKKEWTQAELASRSQISPTNISMLENDRLDIGKKRAVQLAKALGVHPAIIMFPEYEASEISRAA